jgi:hypothetical protein
MRVAAAVFVALHGLGYSLWFLSSWFASSVGRGERTLLVGGTSTGGLGRFVGLLALLVVAGFLVSAWAIWAQVSWWPCPLVGSIALAIPIALLWNPTGSVSAFATLANVGLLAATFMPWGERVVGSH